MAGLDENVAIIGDWVPTTSPTPRPFREMGSFSEQRSNSRGGGGLVERIAARAGFNAPRLNTESIRSSDPSLPSDSPSPYLTIPPGLSPTTLLDSPVFLSNSLVSNVILFE